MFCDLGLVFDGIECVFGGTELVTTVPRKSGPLVIFRAPRIIFGGTEGVSSRLQVFISRIRFGRYRGLQVPFLCWALLDSFFTVPRALGPFFHVFRSRTHFGGVGSCFHVMRSPTHFRRYRGRRVSFSYFALPDSFSLVPRKSGPVFMYCAMGLIFDGTDDVETRFQILRSRTRFGQYRRRRVQFSCYALPDSFYSVPGVSFLFSCFALPNSFLTLPRKSGPVFKFALPNSFCAVPRVSGPVFMFCATGLIFGGTDGVGSRSHVLHSKTHFRRYRGRRVPFSLFTLPDSFSALRRELGLVFMFCSPGLIFGDTEGVEYHFHVLRSRTHFGWYRGHRVLFSCFALPN
jgi:hypothetical protein